MSPGPEGRVSILEYDAIRDQVRATGRIDCPYCVDQTMTGYTPSMSLKSLRVKNGRVLAKWKCLKCNRVQAGYLSYQLELDLKDPVEGQAPAAAPAGESAGAEYPAAGEKLGDRAKSAAGPGGD